jgi:hypothetical protein
MNEKEITFPKMLSTTAYAVWQAASLSLKTCEPIEKRSPFFRARLDFSV